MEDLRLGELPVALIIQVKLVKEHLRKENNRSLSMTTQGESLSAQQLFRPNLINASRLFIHQNESSLVLHEYQTYQLTRIARGTYTHALHFMLECHACVPTLKCILI